MWHVTARMAWHDNGQDETVCRNLAVNDYYTSTTRYSPSALSAKSAFPSIRIC